MILKDFDLYDIFWQVLLMNTHCLPLALYLDHCNRDTSKNKPSRRARALAVLAPSTTPASAQLNWLTRRKDAEGGRALQDLRRLPILTSLY